MVSSAFVRLTRAFSLNVSVYSAGGRVTFWAAHNPSLRRDVASPFSMSRLFPLCPPCPPITPQKEHFNPLPPSPDNRDTIWPPTQTPTPHHSTTPKTKTNKNPGLNTAHPNYTAGVVSVGRTSSLRWYAYAVWPTPPISHTKPTPTPTPKRATRWRVGFFSLVPPLFKPGPRPPLT